MFVYHKALFVAQVLIIYSFVYHVCLTARSLVHACFDCSCADLDMAPEKKPKWTNEATVYKNLRENIIYTTYADFSNRVIS